MGLKFWLVAVLLLVAAVECQASPLLEHDYEVDNDPKELFDDSKEIGEPEDIIDKEDVPKDGLEVTDYEADNVNEPKALALFDDSEEDDYEADNEAKAMFGDSEEDGEPKDIVDEEISDVVVYETDEPVDQTDEESDDTVGDLNMQDPRRRRRSRRPRGRRQRGRRRRRQRGRQRRRGRGRGGRGRRRRRSRRRRRPARKRKGGRRRRLRSGGRRRRNKSRSRRRCFAQICSSHTRNRIRGSDAHGSGAWGAPRGSRTHRGIDVICNAGSSVYAPFSAKVIRESRPYGNGKPHDTGIYMEGTGDWTGYAVMMFYVTKGIGNGASVSARGRIGSMTNMAAQYSRGMTNHIHVQLYRNGGIVNPTPYLNC